MLSVSVAMGTFNGERHLGRQLDSLAEQSRLPAELVITDDGSTDETPKVVEGFARTAPFPVHYHRNETRLGYRANFQRAGNLCASDLIAFCDQDDIWYPAKIAVACEAFDDVDVMLTFHNADVVDAAGKVIGSLNERSPDKSINPPLSLSPWDFGLGFTQVFRRSLLSADALWRSSIDEHVLSEPMAHDQWFSFLASVLGSIVYIAEPLAAYRQHGDNVVGWQQGISRLAKLKGHVENRCLEFDRLSQAAVNRAEILDDFLIRAESAWQDRIRTGAQKYRLLGQILSDRHRLYASGRSRDRLNAFRALLDTKAYEDDKPWTLGRNAMVKDLALGAFLGPTITPREDARV